MDPAWRTLSKVSIKPGQAHRPPHIPTYLLNAFATASVRERTWSFS